MNKINILGIAGSLRKDSLNKAILRAAGELMPGNATLEIFDLEGLPFYNEDLENLPDPVVRQFKAKVKAADAILIATPEYNYSIPGALKNALDIASRPFGDNSFAGKTVAIMGASIGMLGTARAQYHLRQSFVYLDVITLNHPEVMVPFAADKVDAEGRLTDVNTRNHIARLVTTLVETVIESKFPGELAKAA